MEFNSRDLDTKMQHNQLTVKEGLWSRASTVDGGQGGMEISGGSVGIREAIQRQLEKERIREEIMAEEGLRLEAEVRREIRMEMAMAMAMEGDRGFPWSFMLGSPFIDNNLLDQQVVEKYHREIGGFNGVPFKQKVIDLGKGKEATLCGAKRKAREWNCAVCEMSATSEHGLNEHLVGKKHKAKMAVLRGLESAEIGLKTSIPMKRNKSVEEETEEVPMKKNSKKSEGNVFWCEMCNAGPCSKSVMEEHKRGKKHMKKLVKLDQEYSGTKKEDEKAESMAKTEVADSEWISNI